MKRRRLLLNAESKALLLKQFEAFRLKFGRDPAKGDPIFFDPDSDTPELIPDPEEAASFEEIATALEDIEASPAIIYAFRKTRRLVTEGTERYLTVAQREEWDKAILEYERRIGDESSSIEFCFSLSESVSPSQITSDEDFVARRLCRMVEDAYKEGMSSFSLEGTFLNCWLSLVCMTLNVSPNSIEAFRKCLGTNMDDLKIVLDKAAGEFEGGIETDALHSRTSIIREARTLPESWFGRPPDTRTATRDEITKAFKSIQRVLAECRKASISVKLIEKILFRYWLRTWVINNDFPEAYFQMLDLNINEALSRTHLYLERYAKPIQTIQ
jgi:hypothetical protein